MLTAAVEKVVADYFAAIRAMDLPAWLATFADDAVSYEPDNPPLTSHEALSQFFQSIAGMFEKVGLTEDDVFIVGDRAAVKWTGRGIDHRGGEVTFAGIDIFEVNAAGKIQTQWGYWNPGALVAQLRT